MANVSVGATATEIVSTAKTTPFRTAVWIYNNEDTTTMYWGLDNTVTASNGMPLKAGDDVIIGPDLVDANLLYRGAVYGIVSGGTADIRYLEFFKS